ncbi:MAG: sulfite exporter TauE/SafE family protein [Burkholderiales bacterium]
MPLTFYLIATPVVFAFSGLLAMAGLGAAFLFVPFFYYLGVPLAEAAPAALLLNAISLSFAAVNYWRGRLIDWRIALPVGAIAVVFAPLGARLTPHVDKTTLLSLFAVFLAFAGAMMLFYRGQARAQKAGLAKVWLAGAGVGSTAGFIGGLLGVGGGNIIVPALNWLGLDAKRAAATCAVAVVFSSLSGFLGHVTFGELDVTFLGIMALMAAGGSLAGSQLMKEKLSSSQLKKVIGAVLWLVAAKMFFDVLK